MGHAPARKYAIEVAVSRRSPILFGLFALITVFDTQVAVLRQTIENLRRTEKHPLNAGTWRAGRVQRHQDFRHALVGARLGSDFKDEAERFAVYEETLFRYVRCIGQPRRKLVVRA